MACLALHQLVFFAQQRNDEARRILADSTNPKRYFPFAAAGQQLEGYRFLSLVVPKLKQCAFHLSVIKDGLSLSFRYQ